MLILTCSCCASGFVPPRSKAEDEELTVCRISNSSPSFSIRIFPVLVHWTRSLYVVSDLLSVGENTDDIAIHSLYLLRIHPSWFPRPRHYLRNYHWYCWCWIRGPWIHTQHRTSSEHERSGWRLGSWAGIKWWRLYIATTRGLKCCRILWMQRIEWVGNYMCTNTRL